MSQNDSSTHADSKSVKDVLVIGLGAVGAIYSLILKQSGLARVSVVARSNYEMVKSRGMNIRSAKYGQINGWKPDYLYPSVISAFQANKAYSYVVVSTKYVPDVTPLSTLLAPFFGSEQAGQTDAPPESKSQALANQPTYVILQNGLAAERELYSSFKMRGLNHAANILGTAVYIQANLTEDGVDHGDFDRVSVGLYRPNAIDIDAGSVPADGKDVDGGNQALADEFVNILRKGGSEAKVVADIGKEKFVKNLWNATFGAISVLTNTRLPSFFFPAASEERMIPLVRALMLEILSVGRVAGYELSDEEATKIIKISERLHKERVAESIHVPSMLLDAREGKPLELETVVGELVRMAEKGGVAAPRLEMLYAILKVVQHKLINGEIKGGLKD